MLDSSVTICIYVDGGRCTAVTVDLVAQLGREAEEGRLLLVELGASAFVSICLIISNSTRWKLTLCCAHSPSHGFAPSLLSCGVASCGQSER